MQRPRRLAALAIRSPMDLFHKIVDRLGFEEARPAVAMGTDIYNADPVMGVENGDRVTGLIASHFASGVASP